MGGVCAAKRQPGGTSQSYLHITVFQWKEKEKKYTLFDYTTTESVSQTLCIDQDSKICKFDENIISIQQHQVVKGSQELFLIKGKQIVPQTEMWNVVRQHPIMGVSVQDKVLIKEGQTIRLGRVKIVLLEASFTQALDTEESDTEPDNQSFDEQKLQDQQYACRICMSKLGTLNNPLVNPCICSGSVKYTHIKCLSQWINSKIKMKELNNICLYFWTSMQCEICKENYKRINLCLKAKKLIKKVDFQYKDRRYNLLDIPKPKEAYLIFSISHIDKNKEQGLYVINMNGRDQIKIGRIQDNDIKLQDISVSRQHATIHMNKETNSVYIEDHCSKFGTLIQSEGEYIEKKTGLQVVNSLFVFDYHKKGKSFRHYELPQSYQVSDNEPQQQKIQQVTHIEDDDVLINDPNLDNINYLSGSNVQQE